MKNQQVKMNLKKMNQKLFLKTLLIWEIKEI